MCGRRDGKTETCLFLLTFVLFRDGASHAIYLQTTLAAPDLPSCLWSSGAVCLVPFCLPFLQAGVAVKKHPRRGSPQLRTMWLVDVAVPHTAQRAVGEEVCRRVCFAKRKTDQVSIQQPGKGFWLRDIDSIQETSGRRGRAVVSFVGGRGKDPLDVEAGSEAEHRELLAGFRALITRADVPE